MTSPTQEERHYRTMKIAIAMYWCSVLKSWRRIGILIRGIISIILLQRIAYGMMCCSIQIFHVNMEIPMALIWRESIGVITISLLLMKAIISAMAVN